MISEEIKEAINKLGEEEGVKKAFLFDHSGSFICEDSKNKFSEHGRTYCLEQVQSLLKLSFEYRIHNEELMYDLEEARVTILFLDHAILMVFTAINADHTSIQIALNSLGRKINTFMARANAAQQHSNPMAVNSKTVNNKVKPKIRFASRSSTIDKSSLPDVIEADSSFIIYLKKLLMDYAGPKAARDLNDYLHEKQIHVEQLDSLKAYNLIEGLADYLDLEKSEDFKVDAQQVLNKYF